MRRYPQPRQTNPNRNMASSTEFRDHVLGLLLPMGPVRARGMFGGFGIFMDDVMFALIAGDTLFLKIDSGNKDDFRNAGSRPFTYEGKKRPVEMSYYSAPEGTMEDAAKLLPWAESALAAAKRAKKN